MTATFFFGLLVGVVIGMAVLASAFFIHDEIDRQRSARRFARLMREALAEPPGPLHRNCRCRVVPLTDRRSSKS